MLEKKMHGITLIALVVTIVVLLILSGITISMVFGQDGVITSADINSNFKLSNVIETNKDTILHFNLKCLYTDKAIKDLEIFLTNKLNHKCIVLQEGLSLDKVIGIDYAEGKDYTTVTYYNENGNPIKEETIQYK